MIFHPVLNYFAGEYGLKVINIEESGSEPSPADMSRIIAAGRDEGVSVVFVEPQFSQRAARTIAGELDAEVDTLDPLAPDWAANMRRIGTSVAAGVSGS
jgi:zinc transport system substrate-binding protein